MKVYGTRLIELYIVKINSMMCNNVIRCHNILYRKHYSAGQGGRVLHRQLSAVFRMFRTTVLGREGEFYTGS